MHLWVPIPSKFPKMVQEAAAARWVPLRKVVEKLKPNVPYMAPCMAFLAVKCRFRDQISRVAGARLSLASMRLQDVVGHGLV